MWDIPKGFRRLANIPIDDSLVFGSYSDLSNYIVNNTTAYPGQIISVVNDSVSSVYIVNHNLTVTKLWDNSGSTVENNYDFTEIDYNNILPVANVLYGQNTIYLLVGKSDSASLNSVDGVFEFYKDINSEFNQILSLEVSNGIVIEKRLNNNTINNITSNYFTAMYNSELVFGVRIDSIDTDTTDLKIFFRGYYSETNKLLKLVDETDLYNITFNPTNSNINFQVTNFTVNDYQVWHNGNDGSGSGLDADKLDGKHSNKFFTVLRQDRPTRHLRNNEILITPDDKVYLNNSENSVGGAYLGKLTKVLDASNGFDYSCAIDGNLTLIGNPTINNGTMNTHYCEYGVKTPSRTTGAENLGYFNWFEASSPNFPNKLMSIFWPFENPISGHIKFGISYHKTGLGHMTETDADCSILSVKLIGEGNTVLDSFEIKGQTQFSQNSPFLNEDKSKFVANSNKAIGLLIQNTTGNNWDSDTCFNKVFAYKI